MNQGRPSACSCFCLPSSLILHPSSFLLHPSSFILHPSSFILHPSSFILHPSSFILHPSSFILHPSSFSFPPVDFCPSRDWIAMRGRQPLPCPSRMIRLFEKDAPNFGWSTAFGRVNRRLKRD